MQAKLVVLIGITIFIVFEVLISYFIIYWTMYEDLSLGVANAGSSGSSSHWNSSMDDVGLVLCSRTMFKQKIVGLWPNNNASRSSCVCLTDDKSLISRRFNLQQMVAYIRDNQLLQDISFECAMTIAPSGRLGNLMGEYAALYALSKLNGRPAILQPDMARTLRAHFKDVSVTSLDATGNEHLEFMWTNVEVRGWMEPSYARFNEMFVKIIGCPNSWTFYRDFRHELIREFTFRDEILRRVESVFANITLQYQSVRRRSNSTTSNMIITFVGVHVRRTDKIGWIEKYNGRAPDKNYFRKAMDHFRRSYRNVAFVVASDDMAWCRKYIVYASSTHDRDVFFVGEGNVNDPIHDFALLASCNHSIISMGTYSYWTAYLAGGDTVYFTNYTSAGSKFLRKFSYQTMYLPSWKGIS